MASSCCSAAIADTGYPFASACSRPPRGGGDRLRSRASGYPTLYAVPSSPCSEPTRSFIGGLYLSVPKPILGSPTIDDVHLSRWCLAIVIIATVVMLAGYLLLNWTSFGLRVRAALENPSLAAHPASRRTPSMPSLSPSARLAGLPGVPVAPAFSLFADLGSLIQGFLAIMPGGIGIVEGAAAGARVVGVLSGPYPGRWRRCWPTSWFS